jgi:hypothetical protein
MKELQDKIDSIIYWLTEPNGGNAVDESDIREAKVELKELKELLDLFNVSHSTTPNYLNDKYEVKWLINNTYQVEQNGNCVYQGSESDCNEWLKCQLGYCG